LWHRIGAIDWCGSPGSDELGALAPARLKGRVGGSKSRVGTDGKDQDTATVDRARILSRPAFLTESGGWSLDLIDPTATVATAAAWIAGCSVRVSLVWFSMARVCCLAHPGLPVVLVEISAEADELIGVGARYREAPRVGADCGLRVLREKRPLQVLLRLSRHSSRSGSALRVSS